ncbi:Planctomycete cytochrome C [Anatilimnocola aggregata]|uniref:Planctomycete cytochrome C n=1 Tax=Anatilimnocola aggregata TaxID=2528021 RepID=A0A517Y9H6_9BACT|nr:DUF1592 domain-containing protein [Anatilimnocola aggregata]QDU26887.1 Planctomycete cytochrome C [Anatilimnocola aggregata]
MTRSLVLLSGAISLALIHSPILAAEAKSQASMPERHLAILRTSCQKCHGAEKQEGKFRVDDLPPVITNVEVAERWQKVLNALNSGEMPPEDEQQLDGKAKADLLDDLANVMVSARKSLSDQHGKITMRRLNRREYANTLRALLGAEISVSELPADTGAGSFDTVGSNLFMSGNQFEQYLALGREALDEAFERQAAASDSRKLRYEAETTTPLLAKLHSNDLEAKRRGELWIKAVEEAAAKPENVAIAAELRKAAPSEAIFRRSWAKIPGAPSPESFGFNTGENNADKANRAAGNVYMHPYREYYLKQPALDTGAYLTINNGDFNSWLTLLVPFNWPVGDYLVRVRMAATEQAAPERRYLEFGIHPRHGQVMSTHHVTGTMAEPQVIEIPLTLTRKHRERDNRTLFIREKGTADHIEQSRRRFNDGMKRNGVGPEVAIWIDWMEIERVPTANSPLSPGLAALTIPLDDKSKAPSREALRSSLEQFSSEAFRGRTPPPSYVDRLLALYDTRLKAGDKHSAALKETLSVVLSSPMFLYLAEPGEDQARRPLNDQELATRLSYFLWGSPPDATLRDLAERGELTRPKVLAQQTARLLDDPRSQGFLRPFVYQWLNLDRLDFFEVNQALFPRFDDATKLAARNEVYETFEYLHRENASLRDLLKADYIVIDSVLANYYGLDGVTGDAYRKVTLPADSPRGGLLGMAAVNVMGGNGERTSPVERGAWVLRKLLNDPPPPAPANVPQIARLAGKVLTTRERLQLHQEEAQCASCHRKIDPIGFGLENFDAVGQWRTEDSYQATTADGKPDPKQKKTWKIDPAAAFHNGPEFRSYFEMRDAIAAKSDSFARGYSMALIEYALGRPCGFSDEPLIEAMWQRASGQDLAVREFIQALVASDAFHTK